jgi:hypothetical protein
MLRWLVLLTQVLLPSIAYAVGSVSFSWNGVSEATGYKIHYGTSSRSYSGVVDVGASLTGTVPGLIEGIRYYFAASCYDATRVSGYSNEVSTVVIGAPPVVTSRSVAVAGSSVSLVFNKSVIVAGAAPTLISSTAVPVTLSTPSGSGTATVTYVASRQILGAEVLTMSYTQSGSGIKDTADNLLASFSDQSVTNASGQIIVALSNLLPATGTRYRKEVASTTVGLSTNKIASCRYGAAPGSPWATLSPFTITGSMTHRSDFWMVPGGGYQVCSRCLDTAAMQYSGDACTRFSVRAERKR